MGRIVRLALKLRGLGRVFVTMDDMLQQVPNQRCNENVHRV